MARSASPGGKAATAQGYTSFEDWKLDLHRHTRIAYDPKDAWVEPLTEAQKYGWTQPTAEWATKRWPKVSSAETRCAQLLPERPLSCHAETSVVLAGSARTVNRYADSMVRQGEDYLS
eukprot:COSAG02_NODE_3931_length_6026_cov_24.896575_5_plen_118_part_00